MRRIDLRRPVPAAPAASAAPDAEANAPDSADSTKPSSFEPSVCQSAAPSATIRRPLLRQALVAAAVFVAVLYVYAHSFAAWSGARILPESSQQLDVVGLALHATCVVREAVAGLNAHVKPRRIYVVTKGDCETFTSFGPNVVCVLEDTLLPGFTKQDVAAARCPQARRRR